MTKKQQLLTSEKLEPETRKCLACLPKKWKINKNQYIKLAAD